MVQFIFLMQFMMKYMDDLVGKDLGLGVIVQLLFYFSVLIVPISLPLAVLLSSLMAFGTLGEHHELTAIKTAGISLTRILRPVFIVSLLLAGGAFWFNNTIVPLANLEAYSLLWDVRQQKLALDIREGVFYNGIPGYTIKVNQKEGENGELLKGVMIYDHGQSRGASTVILADSGRMFTRFGGQYLGLELFRGRTYTEQPNGSTRAGASFIRQNFDRNLLTFSLKSFGLDRTKTELFKTNKMMLNLQELSHTADSLHGKLVAERLLLVQQLSPYYTYLRFDTTGSRFRPGVNDWRIAESELPPESYQVAQQAANRARNVRSFLGTSAERLTNLRKETANFRIETYRKFTQSAAILLMFLIGAPLGAIIKKGGLGVPILVSIVFFIVYYVFSIMGEKYGRELVMPVGVGMWMAGAILLPIGLFFLYQARHDSGLLDVDWGKLVPRWLRRSYKKAV